MKKLIKENERTEKFLQQKRNLEVLRREQLANDKIKLVLRARMYNMHLSKLKQYGSIE